MRATNIASSDRGRLGDAEGKIPDCLDLRPVGHADRQGDLLGVARAPRAGILLNKIRPANCLANQLTPFG